jgi:hypothetical protein
MRRPNSSLDTIGISTSIYVITSALLVENDFRHLDLYTLIASHTSVYPKVSELNR